MKGRSGAVYNRHFLLKKLKKYFFLCNSGYINVKHYCQVLSQKYNQFNSLRNIDSITAASQFVTIFLHSIRTAKF